MENLIRCLDFQIKQLPHPSVIIGEPIFNVTDITFLFLTFEKKTLGTISALKLLSDSEEESPEVGHCTAESAVLM